MLVNSFFFIKDKLFTTRKTLIFVETIEKKEQNDANRTPLNNLEMTPSKINNLWIKLNYLQDFLSTTNIISQSHITNLRDKFINLELFSKWRLKFNFLGIISNLMAIFMVFIVCHDILNLRVFIKSFSRSIISLGWNYYYSRRLI